MYSPGKGFARHYPDSVELKQTEKIREDDRLPPVSGVTRRRHLDLREDRICRRLLQRLRPIAAARVGSENSTSEFLTRPALTRMASSDVTAGSVHGSLPGAQSMSMNSSGERIVSVPSGATPFSVACQYGRSASGLWP